VTDSSVSLDLSAVSPNPGGTSSTWHLFVLRAVDNESAVSAPEKRWFSAVTIAPRSWITRPAIRNGPALMTIPIGATVYWEGEDLDAPTPERLPVAYEYKLIRSEALFPRPDTLSAWFQRKQNLLLPDSIRGSRRDWVRVPETQHSVCLGEISSDRAFAFAVRAIDAAGATEPGLILRSNMMVFEVDTTPSPVFRMSEETLGTWDFSAGGFPAGIPWEVDVPTSRALRFHWSVAPAPEGPAIESVRCECDGPIPPPHDGSASGRLEGDLEPIVFDEESGGREYNLVMVVRDVRGSTFRYTVRMRVTSFTFSKFALFVDDDVFPGTEMSDWTTSQFYRNSFLPRLTQFGCVDTFNVYTKVLSGTSPYRVIERGFPQRIPLDVIANYQNVIWSCAALSGRSGLQLNETNVDGTQGLLSTYLAAGGHLFLYGGKLAWTLRPEVWADHGRGAYEREFFWRWLFLRGHLYWRDNGDPREQEAGGLYVARSLSPSFPDLFLDRDKLDPWGRAHSSGCVYNGGIDSWEGVKADGRTRPEPGLDSLYKAETWNLSCENGQVFHSGKGAIIAQRYEAPSDTLAARQRARLIMFDFQPFWFQKDLVSDAGTSAVNWLLTGRDR
jgi:hypothetical protein